MWGAHAVIWFLGLIYVHPGACLRIPSSGSVRDRPRPALGAPSTECFSDYMTLQISKPHMEGLWQWLAWTLHLPGTWRRSPGSQGPLLAKCGFLLHPGPEGRFIFQALYSACFVQKEKANYRLEIRIFRKGVKRLEQSYRYIMKCPVVPPRPGQQSVLCSPSFIQVSRPLPLRMRSGQTPWLLSLRGEMVVSLEDASLMGLHVDINVTTVTVQSPRGDLLQRQEVQNISMELLPLWLVGGSYAYSLEAACPLVSSQPGSEVLVHIPRRRPGLVRRGALEESGLSLSMLRAHQSHPSTVTGNQDFLVVRLPAASLLRVQPCRESQGAPGRQASYRVDLSLRFTQSLTPMLWTVENFFQCVGFRAELPGSTATSRITLSPGLETFPEEMPSAATTQLPTTRWAAWKGASGGLVMRPSYRPAGVPGPSLQAAGPPGESPVASAAVLSRTTLGKSEFLPAPFSLATLSSEPTAAAQAKPLYLVSQDPIALTTHLSSGVSSPQLPWRSGSSVTRIESSGTRRLEQDPAQPPGSRGTLSQVAVSAAQHSQGLPDQAGDNVQPPRRPLLTGLAEEASISHQEVTSITGAGNPPEMDRGCLQEGTWGPLDQSPPIPRQEAETVRFTTAGGVQPASSGHLGVSEPPGRRLAAPWIAFPESSTDSISKKPPVSSVGELDRASKVPSSPVGPGGWWEPGTAHLASPPPWPISSQTVLPSLADPGNPSSAGQRAWPSQEPTEHTQP